MQEFLAAQSLKILPQAPFGDAVNEFVNKDDKHAMETFVSESLAGQVKRMLDLDSDEEDLDSAMEQYRKTLEDQFKAGVLQKAQRRRYRDKPDSWDSDLDGHWEDQPEALLTQAISQASSRRTGGRERMQQADEDEDMLDDDGGGDSAPPARKAPAKRGGATGRAATSRAAAAPKAAPARKAPARKPPARGARGKKTIVDEDEEDEESDVVMDEDEDEPPPPPPTRGAAAGRRKAPARAAAAAVPKGRQTTLNFSQKLVSQKAVEISDDEISDDDEDAFEAAPATRSTRRR